MGQKELHPLVTRAQLERPCDARPVSALIECNLVGPNGPFVWPDPRGGCEARLELLGHISAMQIKINAIGFKEIEGRHILIGKATHELRVGETVLKGIRPAFENIIRRLIDPGGLLQSVAAADANVATAHDGDAAGVEMMIDNHDLNALVTGGDGGGQAGGAGANDDDIDLTVPDDLSCGCRLRRGPASHSCRHAGARRRASAQKTTTAKNLVSRRLSVLLRLAGHERSPKSHIMDCACRATGPCRNVR